jgi:hypothetical protein
MRIILIYLARACRAIGNWHVDAGEWWNGLAGRLDALAAPCVVSDNIAKIEPYDREKHGERR